MFDNNFAVNLRHAFNEAFGNYDFGFVVIFSTSVLICCQVTHNGSFFYRSPIIWLPTFFAIMKVRHNGCYFSSCHVFGLRCCFTVGLCRWCGFSLSFVYRKHGTAHATTHFQVYSSFCTTITVESTCSHVCNRFRVTTCEPIVTQEHAFSHFYKWKDHRTRSHHTISVMFAWVGSSRCWRNSHVQDFSIFRTNSFYWRTRVTRTNSQLDGFKCWHFGRFM